MSDPKCARGMLCWPRMSDTAAAKEHQRAPNAQTRSAMAEIDEMVKTRAARFASADEMFAELEEAGGE